MLLTLHDLRLGSVDTVFKITRWSYEFFGLQGEKIVELCQEGSGGPLLSSRYWRSLLLFSPKLL